MAHWFHRNPLKATTFTVFELKAVTTNSIAQQLCNSLRQSRGRLIDLLANASNEPASINSESTTYIGLLKGFVTAVEDGVESSQPSKLRHIIQFRWTNSMLGNTPICQYDSAFELGSILFNVALWYMKHSSIIASKEKPTMEEALEVYKCLRLAAGMFTAIKNEIVPMVIEPPDKGWDLHGTILDIYIAQCLAEAQEITIGRAIELKHASNLIAGLSYETSKMFNNAATLLINCQCKDANKWIAYFRFKAEIYMAYALNFHGLQLLSEDKCGDAIKLLQESQKHYSMASQLGNDYAIARGPGLSMKPHNHPFFKRLGPIVQRTLDKCTMENGIIYHHKIPTETPDLDLKANYGLATILEYTLPPISPTWNARLYGFFDISKNITKDAQKKTNSKDEPIKDIPPVKESSTPGTTNDPGNNSGCSIS